MAFKMKGSPMQRNFGIGVSPMKQDIDPPKYTSTSTQYKPDMKVKVFKDKELDDAVKRAKEASKQRAKIKTATEKVGKKAVRKKAAKSLAKRILSKFIPGIGYVTTGLTAVNVAKRMYKGQPFFEAVKGTFTDTPYKPKSNKTTTTPRRTKKKYRIKTN